MEKLFRNSIWYEFAQYNEAEINKARWEAGIRYHMSELVQFIIMASFVNSLINITMQTQNEERKNLLHRWPQPEFSKKLIVKMCI